MPNTSIEIYKRVFYPMLWPFLEMLEHREDQMNYRDWTQLIERTVKSINDNPLQYLNGDLPDKEIISDVVKEIFADFLSKHEPA